jgi:hypothetical protein
MCDISLQFTELECGPLYSFADWPNPKVRSVAVGVYTVWQGATFLYVGISGKLVAKRADDNKAKGLFKRLHSHALGHRGGNQFCLLVCDRLILPTLTSQELESVGRGTLSLDSRTRTFIRDHLSYRFVPVTPIQKAKKIEDFIKAGALSIGKPVLNGT